jgi:serine protease AprX
VNKKKHISLTNIFLTLALIAGVILPTSSVLQSTVLRVQPLLQQMAASDPAQTIRVIVQKQAAAQEQDVEAQVMALGGKVTSDLHIINAFAAEMTAEAALKLSQMKFVRWISLDAPVQQSASPWKFTTWATSNGTVVTNGFKDYGKILSPVGRNGSFGYGSRVKGSFAGFMPEYSPAAAITKIELSLFLYTAKTLTTAQVVKVTPYIGGKASGSTTLSASAINNFVGAGKAGFLTLDITGLRAWKWSDFTTLQLLVDQSSLATTSTIYYDAVGLRVTTSAGADVTSPLGVRTSSDDGPINTTVMQNVFPGVVRAIEVWNTAPYYQGSGVTVAVVDSGSFRTNGLGTRLIGEVNFSSTEHQSSDQYGHGTHVSGIIGDDGSSSGGQYMGIAPKVNILGLRVADDYGMAYESDVVAAMQWVYDNKATYNIRVVNLSLNSSVYQSYDVSPLDAAAEILWFNSVVVVASAGNNGSATLYPPANDPFVITIGATDDRATLDMSDDVVTTFSAYGLDDLGRPKPDLVAPGKNIIAYLPDVNSLTIPVEHPEGIVNQSYFRMSGTSMAAPVVSGAAALLIQSNPNLSPDQVKYRLMATANKSWTGYSPTTAGAGYLDIFAAVMGAGTQSANTNLKASNLLSTGSTPITWGSVGWNSVGWNSVGWNSVGWNSVGWNSVGWNSDYWGP